MSFSRVDLVGVFTIVLLGCGAGDRRAFDDPKPAEPGAFGSAGDPQLEASQTDGVREVFGHSATTLYRLDPTTKDVTVVGSFQGCKSVIDIALDENSALFGTSFNELYAIDKATAKCTLVARGDYPNSLSFVPKGTVDPNEEALVGYDVADYVRIDKVTGQVSRIGTLGDDLKSSGDIVSVRDGKTYLTVQDRSGAGACTQYDCLVEVDPTTGHYQRNWGPIGHRNVFGLSFWGGNLYGFDESGNLFEVTFGTTDLSTKRIAIAGQPSGLQFWGAGSSTAAPLVAPH